MEHQIVEHTDNQSRGETRKKGLQCPMSPEVRNIPGDEPGYSANETESANFHGNTGIKKTPNQPRRDAYLNPHKHSCR